MNETIRKEVRKRLIDEGMSYADLEERSGVSEGYLSLMLTGHRGKVPEAWRKVLDALGLELTVIPKEKGE